MTIGEPSPIEGLDPLLELSAAHRLALDGMIDSGPLALALATARGYVCGLVEVAGERAHGVQHQLVIALSGDGFESSRPIVARLAELVDVANCLRAVAPRSDDPLGTVDVKDHAAVAASIAELKNVERAARTLAYEVDAAADLLPAIASGGPDGWSRWRLDERDVPIPQRPDRPVS